MKICNKCKQKKELFEFYEDPYQNDGVKTFCIECDNAQSKAYWQRIRGSLTEAQKQARKDAKERWKAKKCACAD